MNEPVSVKVKAMFAFSNGERILTDEESAALSPPDRDRFCFEFHVFIGPVESDRSDSFDVTVCSPSWLADRFTAREWERFHPRRSIQTGTGIWFMGHWDREEFVAGLNDVCQEVSPAPSYGVVADRLSRYLWREYDYRFDDR